MFDVPGNKSGWEAQGFVRQATTEPTHSLSVLETHTALHYTHHDTDIPVEDRDVVLTAHFGRPMEEQIEEHLRQE